jgi:protein-ribulosamine 3-kinase
MSHQVSECDIGLGMVMGEYNGVPALHRIIPENTSEPVAWGTYVKDPTKHFFFAIFRGIKDEMPPGDKFTSRLVHLHQSSVSPTGKFGFPTSSWQGTSCLDTSWCDTWEEFFTRTFRSSINFESSVHGQTAEIDDLAEKMITKVIPRLIRPLETGGKSIKPCLCHGDLWHGNVGVDRNTNEPIIFDPCCVYAHYEC